MIARYLAAAAALAPGAAPTLHRALARALTEILRDGMRDDEAVVICVDAYGASITRNPGKGGITVCCLGAAEIEVSDHILAELRG